MPYRPFLPLSRSRLNLPLSLFFPSGGLEQPRGAASQRLGQREAEAVPPCATPRRDRDTRAGCAAASAELSGELQSQSPVPCRQGGLDAAGFVMAL